VPASSSNLGISFELPSGMQGQTALAGSYNSWGGEVVDIEVIQGNVNGILEIRV